MDSEHAPPPAAAPRRLAFEVLAQRAVEVLGDDTEETLHERIKAVERTMLVEELARFVQRPARRH